MCFPNIRVGVKYFLKYLSQVQVLFHICKYKFKYSEYLGDIKYIKYFFNQVQVKYKYFGNKQEHFPLHRWWIMLLITEYHITWCCFDGSFAGNIFKHILIENVYMSS